MEKINQQPLKTQNIIDIIITVSLYEAWRPFHVSRDIPAPHQGRHRIDTIQVRNKNKNEYFQFVYFVHRCSIFSG